VYPDFNHPNTSSFWDSQLNKMYDRTPYQGIWLDMNEPEAFVEGEIVNGQKCPPIPGISPINETSS
jgi:alpha-glucosidase (family GH31 glycosyl hydrolase)